MVRWSAVLMCPSVKGLRSAIQRCTMSYDHRRPRPRSPALTATRLVSSGDSVHHSPTTVRSYSDLTRGHTSAAWGQRHAGWTRDVMVVYSDSSHSTQLIHLRCRQIDRRSAETTDTAASSFSCQFLLAQLALAKLAHLSTISCPSTLRQRHHTVTQSVCVLCTYRNHSRPEMTVDTCTVYVCVLVRITAIILLSTQDEDVDLSGRPESGSVRSHQPVADDG